MSNELQELFGDIDIYLFDQLLKGRFECCKSVLDVGCGSGRNIHYFLKNNYQVFGIDKDPAAIELVKELSFQLAPNNPAKNFQVALVEALPFEDENFDLVISSAVFHFAMNQEHFVKMLFSTWRVLKPGGYLFARLASNVGIKHLVTDLGNGKHLLPDGSERLSLVIRCYYNIQKNSKENWLSLLKLQTFKT